jgi:hypothetical protein
VPNAGAIATAVTLPLGPELSTGLTPHVGLLELPPGIEGIVPSHLPLTGDMASLQAAAAMGPVISIPSHQAHTAASEGVTVGSGSSM